MSNEFLVSQIQQGIDTVDNLESLYRQNLGLIHSVAKRYNAYVEIEDLTQEGFLALREAVEKYDSESGAFSTYFVYWLRQYMQRYIENSGSTIRIPSHMHSFVVKYIKFARDYAAEYGSEPSEAEISHHLGVGIKQSSPSRKTRPWGEWQA